jgi:hypothetical protein
MIAMHSRCSTLVRQTELHHAWNLRTLLQVKYLVGSGPAADLKLQGPNVAAEHAELQQKGKQVFLKALQGESVFDR